MSDKNSMRIMGLDFGSRTIGIAISDELEMIAHGFNTIKRKSIEEDLAEVATIVSQFKIEKIVVGLPKNMDGSFGKGTEAVFQWIEALRKRINLPVVTWDERFTTVEASRVLLEADLSRKKRKKVIDKVAAVLILQGYLDHSRERNGEGFLSS